MLLKDKEGWTLVAVLPGHKKLNLKKLRKISGHKSLDFMDRKAIEKQLGVVVGALAPFGPPVEGLPVFIDHLIFEEAAVDISSGDPTAGIELMRDDFRRLLKHATVAEITKTN
jgi:Cys-tRNA(Pro)/Cys-tRNA(Cys) deacylase